MILNHSKRQDPILAAICGVLLGTAPGHGQILQERAHRQSYELYSDSFDNVSEQTQLIYVGSVRVAGASSIRVHIGEYDLGKGSYITLASALDGQEQQFNTRSLLDWYSWSAVFNGDEVEVWLHVAPGESGIFVEVDEVEASEPADAVRSWTPTQQVATICNDFDDRSASNDRRVGRVLTPSGWCTVWLVSNGAVLSAGHCNITGGNLVEFNVPGSLANGATVAASPNDQYPVNAATIRSENNGRGEDWVVFGVNPNANTGLRAHAAQGYFRMTSRTPNAGTTLRVTGFGIDNTPPGPGGSVCLGGTNPGASCTTNANCFGGGTCTGPPCCDSDSDGGCESNCNAASLTQQSTTGPMDDLEDDIIEHDVDTMPANSGSPIFVDGSGYAFGIHTSGGCDDFFDGYNNHGTHLHHGALEAALQNFPGPNTIYVDWADVGLPATGRVYEPLHSVGSAVAAVADGGTVALVDGFYPRAAGNTFVAGADGKAMTFVSPVGSSVIGQ